jgi:hypothetical protein
MGKRTVRAHRSDHLDKSIEALVTPAQLDFLKLTPETT